MNERMPEFRMPSDDEVAAERDAHRPHAPDARTRSSGRMRMVVASVAAGALAVGGLAIGIPMLTSPGPQAIVDEYVAAVATGDASAAAALWTPEATEVELALLAEAEPTTPAGIQCRPVEVEVDGGAAEASCEVEVVVEPTPFGGTVALELVRDGGRWSLASGLESRVSLFTGVGDVAAVAGIEVPNDAGVTTGPFLLPGVYAAEVALTPLLEPVGEPIIAVGPDGGALRADHELAPSVLADVSAAAIAAVDPSASGLEAIPLGGERRTWQTFLRELEVGPPGGAPVARVTVEVTLSFDGTGVTIEAGRVTAP